MFPLSFLSISSSIFLETYYSYCLAHLSDHLVHVVAFYVPFIAK